MAAFDRKTPLATALLVALLSASLLPACTIRNYPQETVVADDEYYEDDGDYYYDEEDPFAELSEYGDWIHIAPFGLVWQPAVVWGWQPYNNGHWARTEWGWTWVSYEPFAWATYHYGFWYYDARAGWIWIPDYEWQPVRVQWVWFDDYVGWCPMPPPGYTVGDPWTLHDPDIWVVVHARHFTQRDLRRFTVTPPRSAVKFKSTVRHIAPDVDTIERYTRHPVKTVSVGVRTYKSGGHQIKRVVLPKSQRQDVERYKSQTEKRSLRKEPRSKTSSERSRSATTEERKSGKKEPATRKETKEKKQPEKKQPEKKQPEKKQPEKKQPEKKQPEKKQPEKKQPKKKPSKSGKNKG